MDESIKNQPNEIWRRRYAGDASMSRLIFFVSIFFNRSVSFVNYVTEYAFNSENVTEPLASQFNSNTFFARPYSKVPNTAITCASSFTHSMSGRNQFKFSSALAHVTVDKLTWSGQHKVVVVSGPGASATADGSIGRTCIGQRKPTSGISKAIHI